VRDKPPLQPAPAVLPREILSLPRDSAAPEPQFTVPAPEKPAEQPRDAGQSARATPQPENPAPAKPAPPRLSDASVLDSPVRYPRTAERGRVTLKVLVSREGRATNASMEKSSGYVNLDQHALQAVRRWRFAPARQGSEPVEQWITVNVDY
jgi:protein TonB